MFLVMNPENKNRKFVCGAAIVTVFMLALAAELLWSAKVSAQTPTPTPTSGNPQVDAPAGGTQSGAGGTQSGSGGSQSGAGGTQPESNTSEYLYNLYIWFLGFVGIAALFSIVRGGILYMFSGTSITSTAEARKEAAP